MTPDPVFDQLAGFTPAPALDPAAILFAAGRASAPTPRVWKLAVAGLVLTNLAAVGALAVRRPADVAAVAPAPAAAPEPVPVEPSAEASAPSGLLARSADPDAWPRPAAAGYDLPPDYPLTLAEARRAVVE